MKDELHFIGVGKTVDKDLYTNSNSGLWGMRPTQPLASLEQATPQTPQAAQTTQSPNTNMDSTKKG
jgi:hypothetical protein